MSNPNNPYEVGYYDTPGYAWDVAVNGNYAYIIDRKSVLRIIDISNPSNPAEVGYYGMSGLYEYFFDVAVSGNYVYIAAWDLGLRIIDVSNPGEPSLVGVYNTPGHARGVTVRGDYAYVADWDCGLRIINISNPASPYEIGYFDEPGNAYRVIVQGNYAYLVDQYAGLWIIDISNPTNPFKVGFYDTPGGALDVTVDGNYAYVADWSAGLRVFDIRNPASMYEVGYYITSGSACGVVVRGDNIFLTDYSGLWILRSTGYPLNRYGTFSISSDTTHWYFEKYGDGTGAGTLSWFAIYGSQTGVVKMTQNPGEKGKLSQVFSVPSTGWYTTIAKVATNIDEISQQQKVYLYLQDLDNDTTIIATANQVIAAGNGGFAGAGVWKDMQISFYAQGTLLGVQVVGINPNSNNITGGLYIDDIEVYLGAPQPQTTIAINNASFDEGTTGWFIQPYGDAWSAGVWEGWSGLLLGTQGPGEKAKISQVFSFPSAGKDAVATVKVFSGASTMSKTQKVYLYIYSYDSEYTKIIESGNAIFQPGKWTPGVWHELKFGCIPLTTTNAVQLVAINPAGYPYQAIYFDAVELKQD
ncbi:MAG: hypothetical protein QME64_11610 [bacterium]|nr:hypothetical protein [bacterium]